MSEPTNRIHIGNLDVSMTQSELEAEVRQYGRATSVWVARNPPGFAFVEFDSVDSAAAAIQGLDNVRLGQQNVKVQFAKNKGRNAAPVPAPVKTSSQRHRIVLKSLPQTFTWRELKDEMRRIGDVIYADVDASGDGVVEFANEKDMEYAVRRLDGSKLDGHTIRVHREGGEEADGGGVAAEGGAGGVVGGGYSGSSAREGPREGPPRREREDRYVDDVKRYERDERYGRDERYDRDERHYGEGQPRRERERDESGNGRHDRGGHGRDERSHRDERGGYGRDDGGGYGRDDGAGYSRDDGGYGRDERGYGRDDRPRERAGYDSRDNLRRGDERFDRGDRYSRAR